MHRLHLSLLGTPVIELDDRPVQIKSLKARGILFYVAMAAGRISRDELVALFWPDSADAPARSNLRTQLATLRKQLDTTIDVQRIDVGLRSELVQVDAKTFLEAGSIVGRQAAVAGYRG